MKRIEALCKYIKPYQVLADVGCDHGYLIKEAFNNNLINKAYAIDNKIGPLNNAKVNLEGIDNIVFSLSDGLSNLQEDVDVVAIAGMGGTLIANILEKDLRKCGNVKRFILEPNRNSEDIRTFASNNGLKIVCEEMIEEEGIIYEIIVLEKGYETLTEKEIMFGPIFLKEKPSLFIKKWQDKLNTYKTKNVSSLAEKIKLIEGALEDEN